MSQRDTDDGARETDVCIIVEGCYPYVPGGVSGWIDWLIRSQTETSFSVVALWPKPTSQPPRYALPPNVRRRARSAAAEDIRRYRIRAPGPELPENIVNRTAAKYLEAYERLTGRKLTV